MPYYRDVEVEILGDGGRSFKEHGVTKNYRMKMVSCFIQSQTNERFRICINPDEDLLRRDQQQGEYEEGITSDPKALTPHKEQAEKMLTRSAGAVDEYGRDNTKRVKPWHLLATVKLDGRSEIERREFVLLDENDEDFPDDGLFMIKGATVRDESGMWKQCEWVFKDVGIDVTFESLELSGDNEGAGPAQSEEDLVNAFDAMSAIKPTEGEERSKPGQIEVRLDRVTLNKTVWKKRTVSPDDMGELTELQCAKIGDLGHTIKRTDGKELSKHARVTYFDHMDDENEPYATFRFNYCDESMFAVHHYVY